MARSEEVSLPAVGGYTHPSNSIFNIGKLMEIVVDDTTAHSRLVAVKKKFNQLAQHRTIMEEEHTRDQGFLMLASIFCVCFCCALKELNDAHDIALEKLASSMNGCLDQINVLRANFEHSDNWEDAENSVPLDSDAFENPIGGADRNKLWNNRL